MNDMYCKKKRYISASPFTISVSRGPSSHDLSMAVGYLVTNSSSLLILSHFRMRTVKGF